MTVKELREFLDQPHMHLKDNDEVVIVVKDHSMGATPAVGIDALYPGFDWDAGKVLMYPQEDLRTND